MTQGRWMIRAFIIPALLALSPINPVAVSRITGTAAVIDADTLEIHGQRIRLHAVDAPEAGQRCTLPDGSAWRCGRDAALALADRIGQAPVSCEVLDRDRYGRAVARCIQHRTDLGRWLVKKGWAVAYRQYGTEYVGAEDQARGAARGIWASTFVMPWEWRKGTR